jgi:hypothetical protein
MGTVTSWNPLGHCRPVAGLLYLFSKYMAQNGNFLADTKQLFAM